MKEIKLKVSNMHCVNCANTIKRELEELKNVSSVKADFSDGTVIIAHTGDDSMTGMCSDLLFELGYTVIS